MAVDKPLQIAFNVEDRILQEFTGGTAIASVNDYPSVRLGQKPWVNVKLVTDGNNTALTTIPTGTTANVICDSDYSNPSPKLPLEAGDGDWTTTGTEYYYNETADITSSPTKVFESADGETFTELTEGTADSLSAGEWAWDTSNSRLNIRLTADNDPDDSAALTVYIQYLGTYTKPYFEVDGSTFNAADSWYDSTTDAFRNPDITNGEISFQANGKTPNFWNRIDALSGAFDQNSTVQVELLSPIDGEPFDMYEFNFVCRNKYIGSDVTLELASINYYNKSEVTALLNGYVNKTDFTVTSATELTISAGSVTRTQFVHKVDTEGDASTDDLATISGGAEGDMVLLYRANSSRAVVLKHNTGNIVIAGGDDFTIPQYGYVLMYYDGTNWRVLTSSDTSSTSGGVTVTFTDGDLESNGSYIFSHSLSQRPVSVFVMDNEYEVVNPEKISFTDTNTAVVYLAGWGTLTGTWTIMAAI